jgi:pimeloyl-ACP methyl ester carboxylesterase
VRVQSRPTATVAGGLAAAALAALVLHGCSAGSGTSGEQPLAGSGASTPPGGTSSAAPAADPTSPTAAADGSPSPRPATSGRGTARPPVAGVFLAAGIRQYLSCAGSGALTVLIVPGLGASHLDWAAVLPALQRVTRTCVYDRAGLGSSPPRASQHQVLDAGLQARELYALLRAAGENGPFVVLGHSYGGLVARAFVNLYPTSVRGLLLAESVTPGDYSDGAVWTEAGHRVDLIASARATGGGPQLGSLPLLVLSASAPDRDHLGGPTYGQPAAETTLWRQEQAADPSLSSDAIQVVARSGHVLQQDSPASVTEAVRELVGAASHGGGRLACSPVWVTLAATCS